ncbi:peroxidasin homolog isoform X8 [Ostrea edulis]|uniref:peroxidasin homolog isoform X8 n=1 Tax=Ostrea edulis TaxID=37623 RepID=UPI0024AECADC|nr:peroxidasin homolog isoform X8 [Ostrea edulis]
MERLHSLWIVILLCATNVCSQEKCPEKCVCIRGSTVRCMFLQLDRVPSGIPSTTTVLDLRFNRIRNIPRGTFKELGKITTLLINNNQIQSLENGAFEGLSKLRYLRLDSNLLSCDCNMKWLSTFLRTNTGKIHATAACHSPANLKGRQLSQLTDADFGCDTPHFTMEPRDAIITMGNTAYFSCRAEGKASYKISWLHNDAEVNLQDNRVSMLNDGTLMIHNTVDSDKGTYQCVVRTPNQEIRTNKVQLTYSRAPPSMLTTPSDVSGQVGRSVRLSCQATGIPPPTITWKFNDNTIIPGRKHAVDTVGNLDITNLQTSDQGVYTCQASNAEGFAVSHARVTVQGEAPVLVQQPSDLSLTEGDTARFTCDVSGNPRPNITWFKGNTEVLSTERRIQIVNEGRQLRIVLLQSTDRGTYTCRGENSGGTVQGSARLTVTQTAVPTNNREHDTEGGPGEDITLLCAEDGDPLEATRWIRNGATISPGPKYSLQGNRLTIRRLAQSDFGRYECFPENTLGFARNVVNLNVRVREIQTNYSGHSFVNPAIQQATNRVDVAINQTIKNLFNKNRTHSVQDLITIFRYPSADALRLARAEEIFEQTLDIIQRHVDGGHKYNLSDKASSYKEILSPGHLELIANMSGCFANPRIVRCSEMCYHKRFRSMDGLCNNLHSPTWGASVIALQRMLPPIYENGFNTPVDNIDLFVGGMAEKPLDGGKVGPTFLCIIVDQFKRARDGDRFWYENPGVFEPNQLAEIKQVTLAQIMCESSDGIQRVQRDVFVKADSDADYLECSKIPKLNLKVWSECCTNCEKSGNFQSLTNHFRRGQNTQFSHREDREHNTTLLSRPSTDRSQIRTLNDQMSVIDSKFSKMENEIRGLTKTVVTLKRKLKKVNKYMRKTRKGCYDNKGQKRKNLDRWTVNNCKTCACRGDQVECTKQTCPVLPCASPRTVVGRCCPIC